MRRTWPLLLVASLIAGLAWGQARPVPTAEVRVSLQRRNDRTVVATIANGLSARIACFPRTTVRIEGRPVQEQAPPRRPIEIRPGQETTITVVAPGQRGHAAFGFMANCRLGRASISRGQTLLSLGPRSSSVAGAIRPGIAADSLDKILESSPPPTTQPVQ